MPLQCFNNLSRYTKGLLHGPPALDFTNMFLMLKFKCFLFYFEDNAPCPAIFWDLITGLPAIYNLLLNYWRNAVEICSPKHIYILTSQFQNTISISHTLHLHKGHQYAQTWLTALTRENSQRFDHTAPFRAEELPTQYASYQKTAAVSKYLWAHKYKFMAEAIYSKYCNNISVKLNDKENPWTKTD